MSAADVQRCADALLAGLRAVAVGAAMAPAVAGFYAETMRDSASRAVDARLSRRGIAAQVWGDAGELIRQHQTFEIALLSRLTDDDPGKLAVLLDAVVEDVRAVEQEICHGV